MLQAPIGIAIVVTDIPGNFVACNAHFCSLLEYAQDELLALDFPGLTHRDDSERSQWALRDVISGRAANAVLEKRYIAKSGKVLWCRVHASLWSQASDKPQRLVRVVEDITDRKKAEQQIIKSQLLLKMAGRAAQLGGWTFDNETQELVWSEETCEIHGVSLDYRPTLSEGISLYLPQYRPMIVAKVARCLNDGVPFDFEAELATPDQQVKWVRVIGEAIRDGKRRITGFQGALQDITLQRKNDVERNALAIKLSNTLRDMSDSFFTLDSKWYITYVNDSMLEAVNREREDLVNRLMWDAFPGTENSRFHRCYEQAISTRSMARVVEYYAPLDKWYEIRAYPTEDGVAVYFQDVTKTRRDEEQLRLLQTCVQRMNDIVLIMEAEARDGGPPRVVYVNDAFEKHTGYHADEVIGKTPDTLTRVGTRHDVFGRMHASLKGWRPVREEVLNYTKSGEELWLELEIVPIADVASKYTHWIVIARNITQRKRADEVLRQKDDLLRVGGRVGKIGGGRRFLHATRCSGLTRCVPCSIGPMRRRPRWTNSCPFSCRHRGWP